MATSREQLAAVAGLSGEGRNIVPDIPFLPMPERIQQIFPELEQWNRELHKQMQIWRENATKIQQTSG